MNKIIDKAIFLCADENLKCKYEKNLKLLKMLSDHAVITNLKNNQILAIQDAQVVVLDLNDMYQKGKLQIDSPAIVTALEPQGKARNFVADIYKLNEEQRRAFLIITEHLDDVNIVSKGMKMIRLTHMNLLFYFIRSKKGTTINGSNRMWWYRKIPNH